MTQDIEIGSKWQHINALATSTVHAVHGEWVWIEGPQGNHVTWPLDEFLRRHVPKPNDDIIYVWLDLSGIDLTRNHGWADFREMESRCYSTLAEARAFISGEPHSLIVTYNRTTGEMSVEPA